LRQSHGKYQTGKACTCAYIRDPSRARELRDLQPTQPICHMNLKRRLRLTHARMRIRLCLQGRENPLDLARRSGSEAVSAD
jgi:hypothetical protein